MTNNSRQTYTPFPITEIRELAKQFNAGAIEECIELALQNRENPCYSRGEQEDIMNVLAKVNFVKVQMQRGLSLAQAMRELGKRMRVIQGEQ